MFRIMDFLSDRWIYWDINFNFDLLFSVENLRILQKTVRIYT
jgi:hypothetical protein